MIQHLLGRSCGDDVAFAYDVGFFTDIQGVAHVVVGYQHADAAVAQVVDDLLDVADGDRVDAGKGLIQQDEIGFGGQCPGDLNAPALTA